MSYRQNTRRFASVILAGILIFLSGPAAAGDLPNWRPPDKRGLNLFEPNGNEKSEFEGVRTRIGGNFTMQFQMLDHSNDLPENLDSDGMDKNGLVDIGPGFNNPVANMNLDALLASGIRLNLVIYLSSRHHTEAWVKGGYLRIDNAAFLNSGLIDALTNLFSFKVGHMEINYGDQHFRRTDNGNALYNAFVGNYLMDAFATEIGAEVYFKAIDNLIAMAAISNGEIKGSVENADKRRPAFYGKLGYDKQWNGKLRTRLTGSVYGTPSSANNTLYAGDRSGSRYYLVLEKIGASTSSQFRSGRIDPGFKDEITAFQINPFMKFLGLEFFGVLEFAQGRAENETDDRTFVQRGGELLYRFFKSENLYIGLRGDRVTGTLAGSKNEVTVDRLQAAAGWFINNNMLAKIEYVYQGHDGYPMTDLKYGGEFNGVMLEATVGF